MTRNYLKISLLSTLLAAGAVGTAYAQSASTVGSGDASEDGTSGTIGSGGSAAAGDTSASGLSTGGTSTGDSGTSSTVGAGGSAAAADGRTMSKSKVNENPNNLQGQTKNSAHDGGTWSKVNSKTKVKEGESLDSRTKAMSHEPGGAPEKSTVRESVELGE
jgi:hypothetical protein